MGDAKRKFDHVVKELRDTMPELTPVELQHTVEVTFQRDVHISEITNSLKRLELQPERDLRSTRKQANRAERAEIERNLRNWCVGRWQ